jgi:hypothetical protein
MLSKTESGTARAGQPNEILNEIENHISDLQREVKAVKEQ